MIDNTLKQEIMTKYNVSQKQIPKFLLKKKLFANQLNNIKEELINLTLKYQPNKKEFKQLFKLLSTNPDYYRNIVKFCKYNSNYNPFLFKNLEDKFSINCLNNQMFISLYFQYADIIDLFLPRLKDEKNLDYKLELISQNKFIITKYIDVLKIDELYNNLEILNQLEKITSRNGANNIKYYLENFNQDEIKKLFTLLENIPSQEIDLIDYINNNFNKINLEFINYLKENNYNLKNALNNNTYKQNAQEYLNYVIDKSLQNNDLNKAKENIKLIYLDKRTISQLEDIIFSINLDNLEINEQAIVSKYKHFLETSNAMEIASFSNELNDEYIDKLINICKDYRNKEYNESLLNPDVLRDNPQAHVYKEKYITNNNEEKEIEIIEVNALPFEAAVHNIVNKNELSASLAPQKELSEQLIHNPELWNNSEGVAYISASLVGSDKMDFFGAGEITMGFNNIKAQRAVLGDGGTNMEKGTNINSSLELASKKDLLKTYSSFHPDVYNEIDIQRKGVEPDYFLCTDEKVNGCATLNDNIKQYAAYFNKPIIILNTKSYFDMYGQQLQNDINQLQNKIPNSEELNEIIVKIKKANKFSQEKIDYYDTFKTLVNNSLKNINYENKDELTNIINNYLKPTLNVVSNEYNYDKINEIVNNRQQEMNTWINYINSYQSKITL